MGYRAPMTENECPQHVWLLDEMHVTTGAADSVEQCDRCGAVRNTSIVSPGRDVSGTRPLL